MKRTTTIVYLCVPVMFALGVFAYALRRETFSADMLFGTLFSGFLFYATPYFAWAIVAALGKFSNAVSHAGFIAATVALVAICAFWFLPRDPSGLPLQWMLYWPLALVLQIVAPSAVAIHKKAQEKKQ